METKKIVSFVGLAVLVIGIIAAVAAMQQRQLFEKGAAPATTLSISPSTISVAPNNQFTVNIAIETGTNSVIGTDITLNFDPSVISGVSITPGTFFPNGQVQSQNIDNQTGQIEFVIFETLPDGSPQVGQGIIASVTFTSNQSIASTNIAFDASTIVAAVGEDVGENVLSSTQSGTVSVLQAVADTELTVVAPANPPSDVVPVNININTNSNTVIAAELYLSFDPAIIQAQTIQAGGFFPNGEVQSQVIDNNAGTITYVISEPLPNGQPQQGSGTLATINFLVAGTGTSQIDFADAIVAGYGFESGVNLVSSATGTSLTVALPTFTPTPTLTPTPTSTPTPTNTPTPTVTPTFTVTPSPTPIPQAGDIDGNFCVNLIDYSILFEAYGSRPGEGNWDDRADLVNDDIINLLDYSVLFEHFGEGCQIFP